MNNVNDNRSYSGLVEKYIGTAYDKVAAVADHLEQIFNVEGVILDFYNNYYGGLHEMPKTRPDGSPSQEGDLYYNTDVNQMFYYKLDAWNALNIHTNKVQTQIVTVHNMHGNVAVLEIDPAYIPGSNNLLIFLNDVYQVSLSTSPLGSYEETNAHQITFPNGRVRQGDKVTAIIGTTVTTINPIIDIIKKHYITLTDNEELIQLPDGMTYHVGYHNLEVYLNGRLMIVGSDYEETDTTHIKFMYALPLGSDVLFKKGEIVGNGQAPAKGTNDIYVINGLQEFFVQRDKIDRAVTVYTKGETISGDGKSGFFIYDSTIDKHTANGGDIVDDSVHIDDQGSGFGHGAWVRQYALGVKDNELQINVAMQQLATLLLLLESHKTAPQAHASANISYDSRQSGLSANNVKHAIDIITHYNNFGIHEFAVLVDETVASGSIEGDVNGTDFTNHNLTRQGITPTSALYIDWHHIIVFYDGRDAYRWVGPKGVSVGIGGDRVAVAADFIDVGTGDHQHLAGRTLPDQHPMASITGLEKEISDMVHEDELPGFFQSELDMRIQGFNRLTTLDTAPPDINALQRNSEYYVYGNSSHTIPSDLGTDRALLVTRVGGSRVKQMLYGVNDRAAYKIWSRSAKTTRMLDVVMPKTGLTPPSWLPWKRITDADLCPYDNSGNALSGDTVQQVIDELALLGGHTTGGTGAPGQVIINTAQIAKNVIEITKNTQGLLTHHHDAVHVDYDHTASGLDATNVQRAIDNIVHFNNFGIHEYGILVKKTTANVWGDINAMDFSSADIDPIFIRGTSLHIDLHHLINFHDGQTITRWVGPKDVTIGVGGNHHVVEADLVEIGTGDHRLLGFLSAADQHPISAITNLQKTLNGKSPTNHTHAPHSVDCYNRAETDAKIAGRALKIHRHKAADIDGLPTQLNAYTKAETDAKLAQRAPIAQQVKNTNGIATNKATGIANKALTVVNLGKITALTKQMGDFNGNMFIDNKENVIIGHGGVGSAVKGNHNVVLGTAGTLKKVTTSYNVGVGYAIAPNLTGGWKKTFTKPDGSKYTRDVGENVFMGWAAGHLMKRAQLSVFIARHAGYHTSEADRTAAVGWYSGNYSNKTERCTFMGPWAGDGSHNIGLGHTHTRKHTNVGCFGYRSRIYRDNSITLGDDKISHIFCNTSRISGLSDIRDKTDINPLNYGLDFLSKIDTVSYRLDPRTRYQDAEDLTDPGDNSGHEKADEHVSIGVKAQQVEQVCQELGIDFPGLTKTEARVGDEHYHMAYADFIPVLIKAVQELKAEVDTLKAAQA